MTHNPLPLRTADDRVAALKQMLASVGRVPLPQEARRLAELEAQVDAFEAEAYRQLRCDLSDIHAWMHVRHPDWNGSFSVRVRPGSDPWRLSWLCMWETGVDEVRPELWHLLLQALAALGYDPDGPEPDWTYREVRPMTLEEMSAHRRLEAVARIAAAHNQEDLGASFHSKR